MAPKQKTNNKGKNTKVNSKTPSINVTTIQGNSDPTLGSGTSGIIPGVSQSEQVTGYFQSFEHLPDTRTPRVKKIKLGAHKSASVR